MSKSLKTAIIVLIAVIVVAAGVVVAGNLVGSRQLNGDDPAVMDSETKEFDITITVAGDTTLSSCWGSGYSASFEEMWDSVQDPSYFMKNVAPIFATDDLSIVNFEGTLTDSTSRVEKTFNFKGPAEYVKVLTSSSIEAACLANNHSYDWDQQGYDDTIKNLTDANVLNFGYERVAYTTVKGVKIALIGENALNGSSRAHDECLSNIAAAKEAGAQFIFVFFHWGNEYEYVPTGDQQWLAHEAVDAGADLVVGSHAHVLQSTEVYNGKFIAYGVGNFCFGGNRCPRDFDCYMVQQKIHVAKDGTVSLGDHSVIPCRVSSVNDRNNYQPTPATGEERDRIMKKIENYSAQI